MEVNSPVKVGFIVTDFITEIPRSSQITLKVLRMLENHKLNYGYTYMFKLLPIL